MKFIAGRVNWQEGWQNRPYLELLVDAIPSMADMRFTEFSLGGGRSIFYAELDGYVRFFSYSGPSTGYYGRTFRLTIQDGPVRELVGPWLSRAGAVNRVVPNPVLDISITDKKGDYYTSRPFFLAAHCTLEFAEQHLADIDIGLQYQDRKMSEPFVFPLGAKLHMLPILWYGDIVYCPSLILPDGDIWTKDPETLGYHEKWIDHQEGLAMDQLEEELSRS